MIGLLVVGGGAGLAASLALGQPAISVGSASGEPGGEAAVRFGLSSNGVNVVLITPLVIEFDPAVLSPRSPVESSCTALAGGKSATVLSPVLGRLSIAVSGGAGAIGDGDFLECTFAIDAGAAAGDYPLTFVGAEGSDDQLKDFTATGTSGSVTVEGSSPTNTPRPIATPPPPCNVSLEDSSPWGMVSFYGGTACLEVHTEAVCCWTAPPDCYGPCPDQGCDLFWSSGPALARGGPTSGCGPGEVCYEFDANPDTVYSRYCPITVNGSSLVIYQEPRPTPSLPVVRARAEARPNPAVSGQIVILDASDSEITQCYASVCQIVGYEWEQLSGRPVVLYELTTATATFVAPQVSDPAELVFRVTVTAVNHRQQSASAAATVDVSILPPSSACVGDCDGDGDVAINELVTGVNIALGNADLATCPVFDSNGSEDLVINELITAVNNALNGCAGE